MVPTTRMQAAGLLLLAFEKRSSPDVAKQIAIEAGYTTSPFFGAEKARTRLIGELVMLNAALTIVAVNQVYRMPDAGITPRNGLVMHLDGGIGVFGSAVTVAARTIVAK